MFYLSGPQGGKGEREVLKFSDSARRLFDFYDQRAAELVDLLKDGHPLILNFENLEPLAANKLLAFFAGACYALEGRNVIINEKTYLFARKVDFFDGSLQRFLDNIPKS